MEEYNEPCCPFDTSSYTSPDSSSCPNLVDIPSVLKEIDKLKGSGKEAEAEETTKAYRQLARYGGDWKSDLTLTCELLGMYRHTGEKDEALQDAGDALNIITSHNLDHTVSGATSLLNVATTLGCFGESESALSVFAHVSRVFIDNLDPNDYRFAGLYNNMALAYLDSGEKENAEKCFSIALSVLNKLPGNENEVAVTLCNMAELYYAADPLDDRIYSSMEKAWEALNAPELPMDGYHRFTISKCISAFDRLGYFKYSKNLKERMSRIDESN